MIWVALVGLTLILVRGTIFERVRQLWPALLTCSRCVGFWVGTLAGAARIVSLGHGQAIDAILVGCAVSVLSISADIVLELLSEIEV